jgi:hypothetical protein
MGTLVKGDVPFFLTEYLTTARTFEIEIFETRNER